MHGVIEQMPIPGTHARRAKCKIKLIFIPARKFLFRSPRVFTRCNGRLLRLVHRLRDSIAQMNEFANHHRQRDGKRLQLLNDT